MRRELVLSLVVAIFLFSMIAVQPVKAECADMVEIYQSGTPDSRIWVDSLGIVNWKIRWLGNKTEITSGLIIIRAVGMGVDKLICANYGPDCWQTEYVSFDVIKLEFSVFSVDCLGITDFEQTAENVTIIWDRVVVRVVTDDISEIEIPTFPDSGGLIPFLGLFVSIGGACVLAVVVVGIFRGETRDGCKTETTH